MTKKSKKDLIRKRVKELIKKSLNSKDIDRMANKMFASGVVDLDDYDPEKRGWALPKNMVCAISKELWNDWKPMSLESKKEIDNLYSIL